MLANRGFTLIELLFATFIITVAVAGIIAIYLMSITAWQEGSMQIALQSNANTAIEKMVRGIGGSEGIREATSINCPTSSEIQYTSGIDSKTRRFYRSGDKIYHDPDASVSSDEFIIADNVRTSTSTNPPGFRVQESDGLVTINLGLEGEVRNRKINVDLSTQVKIRN